MCATDPVWRVAPLFALVIQLSREWPRIAHCTTFLAGDPRGAPVGPENERKGKALLIWSESSSPANHRKACGGPLRGSCPMSGY
jgi:hypothetical protein